MGASKEFTEMVGIIDSMPTRERLVLVELLDCKINGKDWTAREFLEHLVDYASDLSIAATARKALHEEPPDKV